MERSKGDPKKEEREKNDEDLFHGYIRRKLCGILGQLMRSSAILPLGLSDWNCVDYGK
jgi:hypothetical protein